MSLVHRAGAAILVNNFLNTTNDMGKGKTWLPTHIAMDVNFPQGKDSKLLSQGQQRIDTLNGDDTQKHGS